MWTALSATRWICLLTLAVVMLSSTSQVDSIPIISLPCCSNTSTIKLRRVTECYEQKPRSGCNVHAFLVKNKRIGGFKCISPDAQWLKDKINTGNVTCPRVTQ